MRKNIFFNYSSFVFLNASFFLGIKLNSQKLQKVRVVKQRAEKGKFSLLVLVFLGEVRRSKFLFFTGKK